MCNMYVEEEAEQQEKKMYIYKKQRNEKWLVDGGKVWQRWKFAYFHSYLVFNVESPRTCSVYK